MNQLFFSLRLFIACLCSLSFGNIIVGQNLVVNPSFENIVNCPTALSSITEALSWSSPTAATPDYFHECDASNVAGIPANTFGFQSARTGSAYAGIQTYSTTSNTDYREYLQVPLINPLIADSSYNIQFYVSPGDIIDDCFTDAIGAFFAVGMMNETQETLLEVTSAIQNTSGNFLTDKGNWLFVSGTYTAQGDEDHLIIGSFQTDAQTATDSPCGADEVAYYYVDDVSVELIPQLEIIGNDSICEGESTQLKALNGTGLEWISNSNITEIISTSNILTVSPTSTTTYVVTSNTGESATFTVSVQAAPIVTLTEDLIVCQGTPTVLDATPSNINDPIIYTWFDDSTDPTFSAQSAGIYSVALEVNGCTFAESVELTEVIDFSIDFPTEVLEVCQGNSVVLDPQPNDPVIPNLNFLWQDGSTGRTLEVNNAGAYSVEISNQCFNKSGEVTVEAVLCDCLVLFPTAFSPNEDGVNDEFRPVSNCNLSNYELTIYSRYGNEIFKSTDFTESWDGAIELNNADQKVYTWVAKYQVARSIDSIVEDFVKSGSVLLLR